MGIGIEPLSVLPGVSQQKRAKLEIALVLLVFWAPTMLTAVTDYSNGTYVDSGSGGALNVTHELTARLGRIAVLLFLMWSAGRRFSAFRLVRPRGMDAVAALGVATLLLVAAFAFSWTEYNFHWFGLLTRPLPPRGAPEVKMLTMTVGVFYEELFYRSFLLTRLKYLGWPAINIAVFSSLLFAATHIYQGAIRVPDVFIFGLILCAAFRRYKSIWPGFFAHWLYDAFVICFPFVFRAILNHLR